MKIQAKHIPERPILEFLAMQGGIGCTTWRNSDGTPFDERSLANVIPATFPHKVVTAKLKSLIRRGLVEGCTCGCRGDWELTAKGRQYLGLPVSQGIQTTEEAQALAQTLVEQFREQYPEISQLWELLASAQSIAEGSAQSPMVIVVTPAYVDGDPWAQRTLH